MSNFPAVMAWAFFEAIYEMSLKPYPYKPDFTNHWQNHIHYTVLNPIEIGTVYKTKTNKDERVILVPTQYGVIPFVERMTDASIVVDVYLPEDFPNPLLIFDLIDASEYVIAVKRLLFMLIGQNDTYQN